MDNLWFGEVLNKIHHLEIKDMINGIRNVKFLDSAGDCVLSGTIGAEDVVDYVTELLEVLPEKCTAMIYSAGGEFLSSIQKGSAK